MRLGTLLLRDAVVSLSQLEAALHSQVLYGGRLGTHLVALGFVELDELARYLGQVLDLPVATEAMFEAVDPGILAVLDPGLAARCEAFPLGYLPDRPGALAVALANPGDAGVIDRLSRALARPIVPHVAPELRIYDYLHRCYGVSREAGRAHARSGPVPAGAAPHEGEAEDPGAGAAAVPVPAEPDDRAPVGRPVSRVDEDAAGMLGHEEAAAALDGAGSRDRVGDALIGFTVGRFGVAVVFIVRGGEAVPWRVHGSSAGAPPALSLSTSSVLQLACERGALHHGRAPCVRRSVERALWQGLGVDREPREMLVVPVLVKGHVVNLIYAHGLDGEAVDEIAAGQLVDLAARAARAYARIIQAGAHPQGG